MLSFRKYNINKSDILYEKLKVKCTSVFLKLFVKMKPDLDINASLSTIFQAVCFIDGGTEVHGENDWPFISNLETLSHQWC